MQAIQTSFLTKDPRKELELINSICDKLEINPFGGYRQIKQAELSEEEKNFIYVLLQRLSSDIEFEIS